MTEISIQPTTPYDIKIDQPNGVGLKMTHHIPRASNMAAYVAGRAVRQCVHQAIEKTFGHANSCPRTIPIASIAKNLFPIKITGIHAALKLQGNKIDEAIAAREVATLAEMLDATSMYPPARARVSDDIDDLPRDDRAALATRLLDQLSDNPTLNQWAIHAPDSITIASEKELDIFVSNAMNLTSGLSEDPTAGYYRKIHVATSTRRRPALTQAHIDAMGDFAKAHVTTYFPERKPHKANLDRCLIPVYVGRSRCANVYQLMRDFDICVTQAEQDPITISDLCTQINSTTNARQPRIFAKPKGSHQVWDYKVNAWRPVCGKRVAKVLAPMSGGTYTMLQNMPTYVLLKNKTPIPKKMTYTKPTKASFDKIETPLLKREPTFVGKGSSGPKIDPADLAPRITTWPVAAPLSCTFDHDDAVPDNEFEQYVAIGEIDDLMAEFDIDDLATKLTLDF